MFTLEMILYLIKRALDDKDHSTTSKGSQSLVSSLKSTISSAKLETVILKKIMQKKKDEMKEFPGN